jgi:uncharacterized protein YcbK (DUF882 family)
MNHPPHPARRRFLSNALTLATVGAVPTGAAWAQAAAPAAAGERGLGLVHTHTRERIELVYAVGQDYVTAALGSLNRFLRDHYSGEVGVMDPQLYELLHGVRQLLGTERAFEVISGYRCPATNQKLRETRGGGVAKQSLHLQGRAIDVRLPGVPLAELRDAALSLRAGGVGYYPGSQFVHIDTGRVRAW